MGRCKFGYHKAIKRSGYPPPSEKNLSSQNKKNVTSVKRAKLGLQSIFWKSYLVQKKSVFEKTFSSKHTVCAYSEYIESDQLFPLPL